MEKKRDFDDEKSFYKKKDDSFDTRDDMERKEFLRPKPVPAPAQPLAKYTIKAGDTLSGIAQSHYGHATRDYWIIIYEANKAVIGDNPSLIKPGVELVIPVLPDNLKGK